MIFNSENMNFNKIKQSETPLIDETKVGWIVGYTQPSALTQDSISYEGSSYISTASLSTWDFYRFVQGQGYWRTKANVYMGAGIATSNQASTTHYMLTNGEEVRNTWVTAKSTSLYWFQDDLVISDDIKDYIKTTTARNALATYKNINNGELDSVELEQLNGKIIKDESTSKFYKISIVTESARTNEYGFISADAGVLYTSLKNRFIASSGQPKYDSTPSNLLYRMLYNKSYIVLEETVELTGDLNIQANSTFLAENHKALDADYCIFVIPCPKKGEKWIMSSGTGTTYTYTYDKSMAMAQLLMRQLQPSSSGGKLIDIQLLPYSPISSINDYYEKLVYQNADSVDVGAAYVLKKSSFTKDIDISITITNPKISNECDVYRIVSPNYASSFEFSPAKNGGVQFFHVNATYKPYTPYINIHPNFGGLYGGDYEDNRGLILAGDYSLPMTSDAFLSYQIQNKNYSNIFDRQMQNMDVQNQWGMAQTAVGAVAGTVQGAAMGAMAGGIPGAIAGGVASAAGGAADIAMTAAMQKENKSYAKDMYNYNLGNIDSKPNSLVKSSAFDISYKMWPFLEYCSCTDVEKEALRSKLKYNGMTVMRIGKIEDYLNGNEQYIQGQLIRLQLNDDAHIVNAIADELARGVYFEGE